MRASAVAFERYAKQGWAEVIIIVLVVALTVTYMTSRSSEENASPAQFRISAPELSGLPVEITSLRSCGCWRGPRRQAQKVFKLALSNGSREIVELTGGAAASIRLIVAYKSGYMPSVTVPDVFGEVVPSPPNLAARDVEVVSGSVDSEVIEVVEDPAAFALPASYRIWAIPANPEKIAEKYDDHYSHPTSVGQDELLPGERFVDDRTGNGVWTFNVPLPDGFIENLKGTESENGEFLIDRAFAREYVAVIGIAIVSTPDAAPPTIIGFAPIPPESELERPEDL